MRPGAAPHALEYSIRFHFDAYYTTSLVHVVRLRRIGIAVDPRNGSAKRIESLCMADLMRIPVDNSGSSKGAITLVVVGWTWRSIMPLSNVPRPVASEGQTTTAVNVFAVYIRIK